MPLSHFDDKIGTSHTQEADFFSITVPFAALSQITFKSLS